MKQVWSHGAISREDAQGLLQRFLDHYEKDGYAPMAVVLKDTEEIIGLNGFKKQKDFEHPDLGFAFLKKIWRQGFAEETSRALIDYSFYILNLKTLIAIVDSKNLPSIALLKKLGFTFKSVITYKDDPSELYELHKNP